MVNMQKSFQIKVVIDTAIFLAVSCRRISALFSSKPDPRFQK